MSGLMISRRRHRDDDHENHAWPGLLDLFAFGMVVMLLLWIQALPEPPKPPPSPGKDPREAGLMGFANSFGTGTVSSSDFVWDPSSFTLKLVRFANREIFFTSGDFRLTGSDTAAIQAVAAQLSKAVADHPEITIVVNGTADPQPLVSPVPPRDNVELSALRAAAVSRVLADTALRRRVQVVGLGEEGDANGKTAAELQLYRRVFLELRWAAVKSAPGT